MKKILLFLVVCTTVYSQKFTVFNIDTSNYPTINGDFYLLDSNGYQIKNLDKTDFIIRENGIPRNAISVVCPDYNPPVALSSVLTIDVSGSMEGERLEIAKAAAKAWIEAYPFAISECAVTSFSSNNNLVQDFTQDRNRLLDGVDSLHASGGTNYDAALLNPPSGGLLIADRGQNKKIIVFLTDGQPSSFSVDNIIQQAVSNNVTIYVLTLGMRCSKDLKLLAESTGGIWFENIQNTSEAILAYQVFLHNAQHLKPCVLTWESYTDCTQLTSLEVELPAFEAKYTGVYLIPNDDLAGLSKKPEWIRFFNIKPGESEDSIITITALNSSFSVTDITSSNPNFDINPKSFLLQNGESKVLTVTFTPIDSTYQFTSFDFILDHCTFSIYATGGFSEIMPDKPTLKVIKPNGGEKFQAGSLTEIKWKGILPSDKVSLYFSSNNGTSWNNIASNPSNLKYDWELPRINSNECLMKAVQHPEGYVSKDTIVINCGGHQDAVNFSAWSPDGSIIATGSDDNRVILWNRLNGEYIQSLDHHKGGVKYLSFSPDMIHLVSASDDSTAIIWNYKTGKAQFVLRGSTEELNSAVYSPDGNYVVTSAGKTAKVWDSKAGIELFELKGHTSKVTYAEFNPDGKLILTCSWDKTVKLWDATNGYLLHDLTGHTFWVVNAKFSHNGKMIISSCWDNIAKLWDVNTGNLLRDIKGHATGINYAEFSSDDKRIVTASQDNTAKIWDVNTGSMIFDLEGHVPGVNQAVFSPDGLYVATISEDAKAIIWDSYTGQKIFTLVGHGSDIFQVSFSSDSKYLLTSSKDWGAIVWDVRTGLIEYRLLGHRSGIGKIKFNHDGSNFITAANDGTTKIWDGYNGSLLQNFSWQSMKIFDAVYSPDGKYIVSGMSGGVAKVWDVSAGNLHLDLISGGHTKDVTSVDYSNNGFLIATASSDKTAKLWNASTGELISTMTGHVQTINKVKFSPDSKYVVTVCNDHSCKVWDPLTGNLLYDIDSSPKKVNCFDFSPDSKFLITGSTDGTIKSWKLTDGTLDYSFSAHTFQIKLVKFDHKGQRIISVSYDDKIKVWDALSGGVMLVEITGGFNQIGNIEISYDDTKIITPNYLGAIEVWDSYTGALITKYSEIINNPFQWGIMNVDISPDDKRIISSSWRNNAKLWYLETDVVLQEDVSDSLWSIIWTIPECRDIDMGKVIVGDTKDSVINAYFVNNNDFAIKIDTIFIDGLDKDNFKIVGDNTGISIPAKGSMNLELNFKPESFWIKVANLNIITKTDTLVQAIRGEGIISDLEVINKIIDFKLVEVGSTKKIIDFVLKNKGDTSITIVSTELKGPDKKQFKINTPGTFTLKPQETKEMEFEFTPRWIGRTSSDVWFNYNGSGTPAMLQLFGEGIGGTVCVQDDSAYVGELKGIKLILKGIDIENAFKISKKFKAKVRVNNSVLYPAKNDFISSIDSFIVDVKGSYNGSSNIIGVIGFKVALGNTDLTRIDILDFNWLDDNDEILDYDVKYSSGNLKILGICKDGGKRLLYMDEKIEMRLIGPNPVEDELNVEINLIEKGKTKLYVTDILGDKAAVNGWHEPVFESNDKTGNITLKINTRNLNTGTYFLVLETPTERISKMFLVIK